MASTIRVSCFILLGLGAGIGGVARAPEVPISTLSVVREHRYVVNARVRPLLFFWIARDNVGSGRLTWRRGGDEQSAVELLVGSDPERAPRSINRWGFISERTTGDTVDVLGLMTDSSEATLAEAEANVGSEAAGGPTFRVRRAVITGGRAVSQSSAVRVEGRATYRDLDRVVAQLPSELGETSSIAVPEGTEHGFLAAMDTVMRNGSVACRTEVGRRARPVARARYVYGATLFDLSLESCEVTNHAAAGAAPLDAVDGRFEIQNLTTKNVTTFRVIYTTTRDHVDVPVRIVFRPRWWMEVEFVLTDEVTPATVREKAHRPGTMSRMPGPVLPSLVAP